MGRTLILAEPGGTHGGDRAAMAELIEVARGAGADGVKWQWVSSPERLARRRRAGDYVAAYRAIAFPRDWLPGLRAETEGAGLEFLCTAYLPEDLPVLAPLVRAFKAASFEAADGRFLRAVLEYRQPVLVSTGMMTAAEVVAIPVLPPGSAVLHCVSAYPAPRDQLNLRAVATLRALRPRDRIGYSDHSAWPGAGALAVAVGAEVLEVHYRLETTPADNPDRPAALGPAELAEYVAQVRTAEAALGTGIKSPQPAEAVMHRYRVEGA
jgi:N,N'-diacetyllegionaminate synthase